MSCQLGEDASNTDTHSYGRQDQKLLTSEAQKEGKSDWNVKDIFHILIQHNCDVDLRDNRGATALHHAVIKGDITHMYNLKEAGANANGDGDHIGGKSPRDAE